jgi:hypothetical protein
MKGGFHNKNIIPNAQKIKGGIYYGNWMENQLRKEVFAWI